MKILHTIAGMGFLFHGVGPKGCTVWLINESSAPCIIQQQIDIDAPQKPGIDRMFVLGTKHTATQQQQ